MAVAKVTIDVDLGELEKDWEAVAWRVPRSGEFFINRSEHVQQCDEVELKYSRIIVRRKVVWPSSLVNVAAMCRDQHGAWWAYRNMPPRGKNSWQGCWGNPVILLDSDACEILGITLPTEWDWTVPIVNPNYKAGGDE